MKYAKIAAITVAVALLVPVVYHFSTDTRKAVAVERTTTQMEAFPLNPLEGLALKHYEMASDHDGSFDLKSVAVYSEATSFVSCMSYHSADVPQKSVLVKWRSQYTLHTDKVSWNKFCKNRDTTSMTRFVKKHYKKKAVLISSAN